MKDGDTRPNRRNKDDQAVKGWDQALIALSFNEFSLSSWFKVKLQKFLIFPEMKEQK